LFKVNHYKCTQAQEQRAQLLACIQSFALIADQATSNQFFRTVMKKLLELSAGDRTKNSMPSLKQIVTPVRGHFLFPKIFPLVHFALNQIHVLMDLVFYLFRLFPRMRFF
jgi:hypothetical protein